MWYDLHWWTIPFSWCLVIKISVSRVSSKYIQHNRSPYWWFDGWLVENSEDHRRRRRRLAYFTNWIQLLLLRWILILDRKYAMHSMEGCWKRYFRDSIGDWSYGNIHCIWDDIWYIYPRKLVLCGI
jgi:hypothetical protein